MFLVVSRLGRDENEKKKRFSTWRRRIGVSCLFHHEQKQLNIFHVLVLGYLLRRTVNHFLYCIGKNKKEDVHSSRKSTDSQSLSLSG